jgi:hypothetical protein
MQILQMQMSAIFWTDKKGLWRVVV